MGKVGTLVVVELVGIIAIQLAQELDNVGVRIGSGKGVARAIKAEHQLSGVSRGPNKSPRGHRPRFRLRHAGGVGSEGRKVGGYAWTRCVW